MSPGDRANTVATSRARGQQPKGQQARLPSEPKIHTLARSTSVGASPHTSKAAYALLTNHKTRIAPQGEKDANRHATKPAPSPRDSAETRCQQPVVRPSL